MLKVVQTLLTHFAGSVYGFSKISIFGLTLKFFLFSFFQMKVVSAPLV